MHPLLVEREEKNVLRRRRRRRQGLCRRLQLQHRQGGAALHRRTPRPGRIDIEPIGRKGRDLFRRRYPAAHEYDGQSATTDDLATHSSGIRHRPAIEVTGDHPGLLARSAFDSVSELADDIIDRYTHEEIDSVYLVYNEFKSVIAQRVVVETRSAHLASSARTRSPQPRR